MHAPSGASRYTAANAKTSLSISDQDLHEPCCKARLRRAASSGFAPSTGSRRLAISRQMLWIVVSSTPGLQLSSVWEPVVIVNCGVVPLNFKVEVMDVRAATEEEMEHGHVHGAGGHHQQGCLACWSSEFFPSSVSAGRGGRGRELPPNFAWGRRDAGGTRSS